MENTKLKATMTIPKNGKKLWTNIMQNPTKLPKSITEGQFIVASSVTFSDGVTVFGGVAAGTKDFNYPLFMVFDKDYNQVGGWPIDSSDWEDFEVSSVGFSIDPNSDDDNYTLEIVEKK